MLGGMDVEAATQNQILLAMAMLRSQNAGSGSWFVNGLPTFHFEINADGHLLLIYQDGSMPPHFFIGDDGHLYLET